MARLHSDERANVTKERERVSLYCWLHETAVQARRRKGEERSDDGVMPLERSPEAQHRRPAVRPPACLPALGTGRARTLSALIELEPLLVLLSGSCCCSCCFAHDTGRQESREMGRETTHLGR